MPKRNHNKFGSVSRAKSNPDAVDTIAATKFARLMGHAKIKPGNILWQTPHYLMDVPDRAYPVRCSLEMEPPTDDPIYATADHRVRVKNGWIDLNDAAVAVAAAVRQVGGKYNLIVGVSLIEDTLQFIVVWEHTSPAASSTVTGTSANN